MEDGRRKERKKMKDMRENEEGRMSTKGETGQLDNPTSLR